MRLIDINRFQTDGQIRLQNEDPLSVGYAILSHTWGEEDDEVNFNDLDKHDIVIRKKGFAKIRFTCAQAWSDGLSYAWVDSCCIDKSSSTELSEAINSMYLWYQHAAICYVYLGDLSGQCPRLYDMQTCEVFLAEPAESNTSISGRLQMSYQPPGRSNPFRLSHKSLQPPSRREGSSSDVLTWLSRLKECRWFWRGWTLQELIAPQELLFFGEDWNLVGSVPDLLYTISNITGIDSIVLTRRCELKELSVAKKLSWAAHRATTRVEDEAYCLLGLLNINMTLLYGEGEKAFVRLQEEIIKTSADTSLFAWFRGLDNGILAPSLRHFRPCGKIVLCNGATVAHFFERTHRGVRMRLPLLRLQRKCSEERYLAILNIRMEDDFQRVLCLHLKKHAEDPTDGGGTILCSVENCTQQCANSQVRSWEFTQVHSITNKKAKAARYCTVLIPRHNFQSQMSLSMLRHTQSVWVRTLPQCFELVQCFPKHQWNLQTRVMNRYANLSWYSFDQYGGLLLKHESDIVIAVCFAVGSSQEFIKVLGGSKTSLREICESLEINRQRRHGIQRRAVHRLRTGVAGKSVQLQAMLREEVVVGERIWMIDLLLKA